MRTLILVMALAFASAANAADVLLQWTLPATDCQGDVQPIADELEIFVADAPMLSDDTPCDDVTDERPAGGNVVLTASTPNAAQGDLPISLLGGATYYARARLRVGDEWSDLSGQITIDVPKGVLQVPVIIQIGGG